MFFAGPEEPGAARGVLHVRDSGPIVRWLKKRSPAMRCLALTVLVLSAALCRAAPAPRRPASPASARAARHQEFVWREAGCRVPQPRVQCLKELHPNDTRKFVPHCTILHRCAPDTGCCAAEEQHCQARTVQAVQLPFLVLHLDAGGGSSRYEPITLVFDNHTECECRLRNEPIR